MDKQKMIKQYKELENGNDWDIIHFADKYLKDEKYQKDITNATEQAYTYDVNDRSGDVYYLIQDIKEFVKQLKQ